jgi:hypothetical protein
MAKRVSLSGEEKSLETILSWYDDYLQAINDLRYKIMNARTSSNSTTKIREKFKKLNLKEIGVYFDDSEDELERLVCLDLISATEAFLRIDYHERIKEKDKSEIGRFFRSLNKKKGKKISLEEDIIETWKSNTGDQSFSNLLGLLKYRHWLAHGRYWAPKLGRTYSFDIAYEISANIFNIVSNQQ